MFRSKRARDERAAAPRRATTFAAPDDRTDAPAPEAPIAPEVYARAAHPSAATVPIPAAQTASVTGEAASAWQGDEQVVVPRIEEVLAVDRREVETARVRITKTVEIEHQEIARPVTREKVSVQRVLVNRYIDAPVPARQEGPTLIVPVIEEVVVVKKRLLLREEVHITKQHIVEVSDAQHVELRRERVHVERTPLGDAGDPQGERR